MLAILPFAVILLFALAIFLGRFFGSKISTKLSIRMMGVYGVILLLSPLLASFATDAPSENDGITATPDYYFQEILTNYENYSLKDLKNDAYLEVLQTTKLEIFKESFSENDPFVISTTGADTDEWYDRDYGYTMIVERTAEVDSIVITQFQQRAFIEGYEVTQSFEPWIWSLDNWRQDEGRLKATPNRSQINLYYLSPPPFAFQFDGSIINESFGINLTPHLTVGRINWIQIPEDLPIRFQGSEPYRLIEGNNGTE